MTIMPQLTDDEVRKFRQANPLCVVRHRFGESLQAALKPTTRLRIRSGGTCHRREELEKTLFETKSASEIKQFLVGMQVVEGEAHSGWGCFCCRSPSLEFYEGDRLIETVGFHHRLNVRWKNWPSDAALTKQSADFLLEWMASRGVTGPLEERQEAADREKDSKEGRGEGPDRK